MKPNKPPCCAVNLPPIRCLHWVARASMPLDGNEGPAPVADLALPWKLPVELRPF